MENLQLMYGDEEEVFYSLVDVQDFISICCKEIIFFVYVFIFGLWGLLCQLGI